MSNESYYTGEEIDLRYPELAYNKKPIFRPNPGVIPFYIPALYPYLAGGSKPKTDVVKQNNNGLLNKDKPNISNVNISNCINITVPREVCSYLDQKHKVVGFLNHKGVINGPVTLDGNLSGTFSANMSHPAGGGPHDGSATISSMNISATLNGSGVTYKADCTGDLTFYAYDNTIPKDTAWVVMFIGGDINKPVIIGRYYE